MPKVKNVSGYEQVIRSDYGNFTVGAGSECDVPAEVAADLATRPGWQTPKPAQPKPAPAE